MTKKQKVVGILVASFFAYAFALNIFFGDEETQTSNPVPTASATPSNSESTCLDIRNQKGALEEEVDRKNKETLKEIESTQKAFLLNRLRQLKERNILNEEEFNQIIGISEGGPMERLKSFPKYFLQVSDTLDRLIRQKHLKPYYEDELIAKGEQLADTPNPTYEFVLKNKKCFDEYEVSLAESMKALSEKPIKSGWRKKKTGADFAGVLNEE